MHRWIKTRIVGGILVVIAVFVLTAVPQADESVSADREPRFRGPVALVLLDDGHVLLTANRRSGSISVIDAGQANVIDEITIGKNLSDLVAVTGRNLLLATDDETHELVLLKRDGRKLKVARRLPVAQYPVSIAVNPD